VRRRLALALGLTALALTLAACGRDSNEATTAPTSPPSPAGAFAYAQCMRDNGVPEFPDPVDGQLRFNGESGSGLDPLSPEFQAAERACRDLIPPAPQSRATPQTGAARPGDQGWKRIVPGGDCRCSDGSKFGFWVRKADPKKVVFYLQGGGACFSAETCAPQSDLYRLNLRSDDGPAGQAGMFDLTDKRNPFADYSIVYVPYCTGDVHLGDTTTNYASGLTVRHKGYVNGTAALDYLATTFPESTNVVVMGESAGSIAAPLYAGLVSDRLANARITVLADGSGSYPDAPRFNNLITAWGAGDALPDWAKSAGRSADHLSFPGLFIQSARHDPKIVFARHDHAYDETQELWYPLVGVSAGDLLSLIDANESQIEDAGVNLLSYTAPGSEHSVLSDEPFYTEQVNGLRFIDWVTGLIEGKPVGDVHCHQCRGG
jgi:Pectinacetylesterase